MVSDFLLFFFTPKWAELTSRTEQNWLRILNGSFSGLDNWNKYNSSSKFYPRYVSSNLKLTYNLVQLINSDQNCIRKCSKVFPRCWANLAHLAWWVNLGPEPSKHGPIKGLVSAVRQARRRAFILSNIRFKSSLFCVSSSSDFQNLRTFINKIILQTLIYSNQTYSVSWHHPSVQGIEKISPRFRFLYETLVKDIVVRSIVKNFPNAWVLHCYTKKKRQNRSLSHRSVWKSNARNVSGAWMNLAFVWRKDWDQQLGWSSCLHSTRKAQRRLYWKYAERASWAQEP